MNVLGFGLIYLSSMSWVAGQGAQLTKVDCTDSPCESTAFRVSFKLTGTLPTGIGRTVGFYRNGEGNTPLCLVDRIDPCNTPASCGCTDTAGERTFHYEVSSATSSQLDGDWTAVLQASSPANTVRSSACTVQVNNSCPYLVGNGCPTKFDKDEPLIISFAQARPFPNTAGSLFTIMNNSTKEREATINRTLCPQLTQPAGCFRNGGTMIFYLNFTSATAEKAGDWMAYITDTAGTIESDRCHVDVEDQETRLETIAFIIIVVLSCGGTVGSAVITIKLKRSSDAKLLKTLLFVLAGVGLLIMIIIFGVVVLGFHLVLIGNHQAEYGVTIAVIVIGCLLIAAGIVVLIVAVVKKILFCEVEQTPQNATNAKP